MFKPHHRMYAAAFLLDCAIMVGFTVVPFFVMRQLGGGARMVGVISGTQGLAYAVGALASSRIVTRAKNGLTWARVGILGYAFLFCPAHLMSNPWVYGVLSSMGTGCMALVWPALWSWLGAEPDLKTRTRRIAHYNISWSIGLSIGPLFSGRLYEADYRFPFLCAFGLVLGGWLLVMRLPHEKRHFAGPSEDAAQEHAAHAEASEAHLYCAWSANLLGWIMAGACRSVFATRVNELFETGQLALVSGNFLAGFTFSEATIAFSCLVFTINFSRVIVFFLMGRTHRWHHRLWVMIVFQIAAAAAMWRLGITRSFAEMTLCCFLVGLNNGVGFFVAVFYSLSNPIRKHQRASINETMVGAGGFLGSTGFGILAQRFGLTMPFLWSPVMVAAAIAAQWGLLRYGTRRNRGTQV